MVLAFPQTVLIWSKFTKIILTKQFENVNIKVLSYRHYNTFRFARIGETKHCDWKWRSRRTLRNLKVAFIFGTHKNVHTIAFWPEQQGIGSVCDESTKSVLGLLGSHFPIILPILLSPFPFSVAVSVLFCCSHELLLKQTEQMSRECIALALCIGIAVSGFLLFTFQLKLAWRYISAWGGAK